MKADSKWLMALFGVLAILLFWLSYSSTFLLWDENAYLGNARSHLTQSNYTEDFRYPLLEYIISGVWYLTGESILLARLVMSLFYLAAVYLFYLIAKPFFKNNLLLTIIFAASPPMMYWGFRIYTDVFVVFFILLSFYLIIKNKFFFGGVAASLAFLAKFTSILFLIAAVLWLIFNKKVRDTVNFCAGSLVALLPWLIYNQITYSNPFWDFFAQLDITSRYNKYANPLLFLKDILIYAHIFLVASLAKIKDVVKNKKMRFALIFVIIYVVYIAFVSEVKSERYLLSIIPFIYIIGFYALLTIKKTRIKKNALLLLIIISTILLIWKSTIIITEISCNKENSILKASEYLRNESNIDVVSNVWPWFGYRNNFRVHSLYASIEELKEAHHPKYVVYNKGIGDPYDENQIKNLNLVKEFRGLCNDATYIYSV